MQTIFTVLIISPLSINGFLDFSFFYLYDITEHGNSFLKSIIASYGLHSVFRYLVSKLEKLRQPVAKYTETTTFCKSIFAIARFFKSLFFFSFSPFLAFLDGLARVIYLYFHILLLRTPVTSATLI